MSTLAQWATAQTWAIERAYLEAIIGGWLGEQAGPSVAPNRRLPEVRGNVAIIPLYGVVTQRGSVFADQMGGGASTQAFEAAFSRALNSERVSAIVLDVDSPGGTTAGVETAAARVHAARGIKPIVSVANSQMASAAYWIGSAAEQVVAAPGADVGSIGVFRMHEDVSGMMEQAGVNVTFIAEPDRKTEGNPFESLSAEALEHQQSQVHETYMAFNSSVAAHRGVPETEAANNFGRGRSFHAKQAKQIGLVDRVRTINQVLSELGVGKSVKAVEAATAELVEAWETKTIEEPRIRHKNVLRKRLDLTG